MLEVKVPSVAEMMDIENRAEAAVETKWKSKLDNLARELEATRISVQNLLGENLRLRSEIKRTEDESVRTVEVEKAASEKKVLFSWGS